jgi:hypothetical protein
MFNTNTELKKEIWELLRYLLQSFVPFPVFKRSSGLS